MCVWVCMCVHAHGHAHTCVSVCSEGTSRGPLEPKHSSMSLLYISFSPSPKSAFLHIPNHRKTAAWQFWRVCVTGPTTGRSQCYPTVPQPRFPEKRSWLVQLGSTVYTSAPTSCDQGSISPLYRHGLTPAILRKRIKEEVSKCGRRGVSLCGGTQGIIPLYTERGQKED